MTTSDHPLAQVARTAKEVAESGHRGGPVENAGLPYQATIETTEHGDVVAKVAVPCVQTPPQLFEASCALCDAGFTRFSYKHGKGVTHWTIRLARGYPALQLLTGFDGVCA